MVDKELIKVMSDMLDEKLDPVKEDMDILKAKMGTMENDIGLMKEDIGSMKEEMGSMKNDIDSLKEKVGTMEGDVKKIQVTQENEILPILRDLSQCYTDTYDRYRQGVDEHEEMKSDIAVLKVVVAEHSETLKRIS